jgi:hypothetical protein
MRISKIYAKATYHKGMKDLHAFGYISYKPSYNPYRGSLVYLFPFNEGGDNAPRGEREITTAASSASPINSGYYDNSPSGEQVLVPSINRSNKTKNKNEEKALEIIGEQMSADEKPKQDQGLTKPQSSNRYQGINQTLFAPFSEISHCFQSLGSSEIEAERFFNYYSKKGWRVGSQAPMTNWKSAARNWVANSKRIRNTISKNHVQKSPNILNQNAGKDYSEPL